MSVGEHKPVALEETEEVLSKFHAAVNNLARLLTRIVSSSKISALLKERLIDEFVIASKLKRELEDKLADLTNPRSNLVSTSAQFDYVKLHIKLPFGRIKCVFDECVRNMPSGIVADFTPVEKNEESQALFAVLDDDELDSGNGGGRRTSAVMEGASSFAEVHSPTPSYDEQLEFAFESGKALKVEVSEDDELSESILQRRQAQIALNEEELKETETAMVELLSAFHTVAQLVKEQGEEVETLESLINKAQEDVEEGTSNLAETSVLATAGAAVVGAIAGGLTGGPVGAYFGATSSSSLVGWMAGGAIVGGLAAKKVANEVEDHLRKVEAKRVQEKIE